MIDRPLLPLASAVTTAHILGASLFWTLSERPAPFIPKPFVVQTVALTPKVEPKPAPKSAPPPKTPSPPPPKPSRSPIAQAIQKGLAALEETKPIPATSTAPQLEKVALATESTYATELIAHLQRTLRLPEPGSVTVAIRLQRNGAVLDLTIQSATSPANRRYIETTLPRLQFPPLPRDETGSFTLTLTGETAC